MRVQHSKERVHVRGGRGNFEGALIQRATFQTQRQLELGNDAIGERDSCGELLDETAQREKEWLNGFNSRIKIHLLFKYICRPCDVERANGLGAGPMKKFQGFCAEP